MLPACKFVGAVVGPHDAITIARKSGSVEQGLPIAGIKERGVVALAVVVIYSDVAALVQASQ